MNEPYIILKEGATAETELKKSRFIGQAAPVETVEEALSFVESVKKKYYDARHNCYAYVIGKDGDTVKFSDDGEPSQTAGLPMYSVIKESGIRNVVVVVTRYFGGTLLGAGPLSGMYREATSLALKASKTARMEYGIEFCVSLDYSEAEKVKRLLAKEQVQMVDTLYESDVKLIVRTGFDNFDIIKEKIISLTASKAKIEKRDETYFEVSTEDIGR